MSAKTFYRSLEGDLRVHDYSPGRGWAERRAGLAEGLFFRAQEVISNLVQGSQVVEALQPINPDQER